MSLLILLCYSEIKNQPVKFVTFVRTKPGITMCNNCNYNASLIILCVTSFYVKSLDTVC